MIFLIIRFSSKTQALTVARNLSGNPDVQELPPDGWLNGVYYNIQPVNGDGSLYRPTGKMLTVDGQQVPEMAKVNGYHIIGRWTGTEETLPQALKQYIVDEDFGQVFG